MKTKLLTIKSLLVAVALCVGQSAWADVTPFSQDYEGDGVTPDWTSGNTTRYTTSIAESSGNHYVQVSSVGDGGNGALITGNSTNGKAASGDSYTLIFDLLITGGDNQASWFQVNDANNKNTNINGSATPSDCVLLLQQTTAGGTSWKINNNESQTVTLSKTSWNRIKLTVSGNKTYLTVTDVSTDTDIFPRTVITTNSSTLGLGGIQFATKRKNAAMSIDNVVVRAVADGDLPTETYYTATFTDNTTGNNVTTGTTIYTDSEHSSSVANGMLANGTTYYYTATQTAYVDYEGSFTVAGADPAISFSMTAQPTYSYTVNAVDGSSNALATLASGSSYNTASVNYAYPEYINVNGTLYTKAATSQEFGTSFTLSSDAQVENATYSASDYTNVIYYAEAESITGMTASNSGQGDARCSNRYGAYAESNVEFITLPAGTYKIYAGYCGGTGTTFTIKAGEATVWSAATTGSRGEAAGVNFTVDGSTPLTIAQAGGANVLLDNIIIQKVSTTNEVVGTADYTTTFLGQKKAMTINKGQTINVSFKNHGGTSQWFNWLVRFYTTGLDNTLRADNWVIGDADATNGTRSVKLNDTEVSNWAAFTTDMANATVDMAIAYTAAGMFSITATAVGGGNTYTHSYSYNTALTNAINLELGVEKSWLEITSYDVVNPTSVPATLGANGYATFASPYPLDLANLPSGVTAYKAAVSGTTVTFTPLDQTVPANTGVLLKGAESAEVSIPVVASGTDVTENAFLVNTTGSTFDAEDGYTYFGMMKAASSSDAITFATFDPSSVAIPANKAYLKVLTSSIATAPSLTFIFDDGQTTGIDSVKAEGLMLNGSVEYYNLAGQRVAQPTKGLYIVNGRKVVVK